MPVSRSRFSTLFPPPEYLVMPAVGINISDHAIKMMELKDQGTYFTLGDYETILLDDGVVSSGKIIDTEKVIIGLKDLKARYGLNFIRGSIPEEEGYIFSISLSNVEDKDLQSAVEFRIPDNVPLAPSEAVFDYNVIRRQGKDVDITVTVLPKSVVEQHIEMYTKAGLTPLSLEIEAQTTARSVVPVSSEATIAIIDVGRTRTGISVVDRQIVRYTSTFAMGGDTLASVIEKGEGVSFSDAENLKRDQGIIPVRYSDTTNENMQKTLASFAGEVVRTIEFWNSQTQKSLVSSKKISSIILCGGNATAPGFREGLAGAISLPVTIGNVWHNAFPLDEYIPPIDFNHSLGYASAVGLALMG